MVMYFEFYFLENTRIQCPISQKKEKRGGRILLESELEGILAIKYNGGYKKSATTIIPHGRGRLIKANGEVMYDGHWKDGYCDGYGVLYDLFSGMKMYTGDFVKGLYEGKGTAYNEDGKKIYTGDFLSNMMFGKGTKYCPHTGKKTYRGEFSFDARSGIGTSFYMAPHETKKYYTGQWKNDMLDGIGYRFYRNGLAKYYGGFIENQRYGFGISYWEHGPLQYAGQWYDNQKNGLGVEYSPNGQIVYYGNWKDNQYHGEGTLYGENFSIIFEGIFENGIARNRQRIQRQRKTHSIRSYLQSRDPKILEHVQTQDISNFLQQHGETPRGRTKTELIRQLESWRERGRNAITEERNEDVDPITDEPITDPVIANDGVVYDKSTLEQILSNLPQEYDENYQVRPIYPRLIGGQPVSVYYTMEQLNRNTDISNRTRLQRTLREFLERRQS